MSPTNPVPPEFLKNEEEARESKKSESRKAAWPQLDEAALHGLPGEVVNAVSPHTEADEVALLASLLTAVGNAMGRGAFVKVGADTHHLNLNAVLVGQTAKGRKGSSWGFVRDLLHTADPFWCEDRVMGGLSSGEGLIYAVRDRVTGEDKEGAPIVLDPGVQDKRLLVLEGEFAGVLKVASREGNTLNVLIRQAWDGGKLAALTKNSPMKATDAHISIVGHITAVELVRLLSDTDAASGFANRFLWLMVRRSKALPFGGEWHKVDAAPLTRRIKEAVEFGEKHRDIAWGHSAREKWSEVYEKLSEGRPGLFGSVTSRSEAQTLRLAVLYAVLDGSRTIEADHLKAALALWKYAEDSARYIFGDATGDPVADKIMAALEEAKEESDGLTRTELSYLFKRHRDKGEIDRALGTLSSLGKVRREKTATTGRPVEKWFAA